MKILQKPGFYQELEQKSAYLANGLAKAAKDAGCPIYATRVGSMFCSFFTQGEVHDWPTASACNTKAFASFFCAMLAEGIYLAPSQFETGFVSHAHTESDLDKTIAAARKAFKAV